MATALLFTFTVCIWLELSWDSRETWAISVPSICYVMSLEQLLVVAHWFIYFLYAAFSFMCAFILWSISFIYLKSSFNGCNCINGAYLLRWWLYSVFFSQLALQLCMFWNLITLFIEAKKQQDAKVATCVAITKEGEGNWFNFYVGKPCKRAKCSRKLGGERSIWGTRQTVLTKRGLDLEIGALKNSEKPELKG